MSKDDSTSVEKDRPKAIDEDVYRRGIAQANTSKPSASPAIDDTNLSLKRDALQPVSALGAFPLVASAYSSQLPPLLWDIRKGLAICAAIWAGCTLAFLPTLRAIPVVISAAVLGTFSYHHSVSKIQIFQEDQESANFEARSKAIKQAELPESVEWLNALIEGIWPRIPAEMFSSVADELEDVIQANLPKFVSEVKCAELTQGKNPLRVLSSRLLPPTKEDEEEALWNGGVKKHIQLEIAFAYRAREKRKGLSRPTKENSRKVEGHGDLTETATHGRQDARILFLFQAKVKAVSITLPVRVQLNGLVGIARIRLETVNSSPFLGNMDISFVGLPRVSLDIIPLKLSLAEVPGLSNLIQGSVDSALEMYTFPKKLSLNLGELIVGDGIKKKCDAAGIVVITVHSAHDLERSDWRGMGDPYVRVGWSRTATASTRVTRVIKNDLNPVWEQTFALIVSPQVMAALSSTGIGQDEGKGESVLLEIYDSDTSSDDDFIGKSTWPLQDILGKDSIGQMKRREDVLYSKRGGEKRGGKISWSVGFFAIQPLVEKSSEKREKTTSEGDDTNLEVSPSKSSSFGILSIQIHDISSLRFRDCTAEEAFEEAPSSYVEVLLADRRVFRSRTKMDDGEPCFNAITEQVCDWKTSNCIFVIRENKVAGKDAILGVVPIQLSKVFQKSTLITDVYPLAGGIGSGRLKISLLFTPVELPSDVPRLLTPVGVLTVHSIAVEALSKEDLQLLQGASVEFDALSSKARLASHRYEEMGERSCQWQMTGRAFLPIYRREAVALIVKLRLKKNALSKRKSIAVGVLWLNQLVDKEGEEVDATRNIELAIWDVREDKRQRKRLERNWIGIDERDEKKVGLRLLGTAKIRVDFYTGVTRFHAKANQLAGDSSKVYEAWKALQDAGFGDQSSIFDNIPRNPDDINGADSSSSSSESEGEDDDKRWSMQVSGSKGQMINRMVRKGDHERSSIKEDLKENFSHLRNKFRTDNDKATGVETEV